MDNDYVLLNTKIASDVILKVLAVKRLLSSGSVKKTGDAIEKVGISRSAFYKYKDYVFDYSGDRFGHMFTLSFELRDVSGVLSEILKTLAAFGCNVLTINQNIPINSVANVTVTARIDENLNLETLTDEFKRLDGVIRVGLLAMQ